MIWSIDVGAGLEALFPGVREGLTDCAEMRVSNEIKVMTMKVKNEEGRILAALFGINAGR